MTTNSIPDGFHSLTPYLVAKDAQSALVFYQKAFDAEVILKLETPDGGLAHAELRIGNSIFMLTEEYPDMGFHSPESLGGAGVSMMIYLDDVDSAFTQAISAGAEEMRPVIDQFYGDRAGTVKDPFGHVWTLATHIEDLSDEALEQRMAEYFKKQAQ